MDVEGSSNVCRLDYVRSCERLVRSVFCSHTEKWPGRTGEANADMGLGCRGVSAHSIEKAPPGGFLSKSLCV